MSIDDQRWRAVEVCDLSAAGTFVYGRDSDQIYHSPLCRNRPVVVTAGGFRHR